jgi:hypothetical protein
VLSVRLRITDLDYPFGILKLFRIIRDVQNCIRLNKTDGSIIAVRNDNDIYPVASVRNKRERYRSDNIRMDDN